MSFLEMFFFSFNRSQPGWMFMWVILTTAVFALAVAIERFIALSSKSLFRPDQFMKNLTDCIKKDDLPSANNLIKKYQKSALGLVLRPVVDEASNGADRIRNSSDEAVLRVIPALEKRTAFLGTIGNVATLLGLMGTIYGLIISFAAVGRPGIDPAEKSALLAQGIAAAMNTTYMGLLVAIPCIALYTFLKGKTQKIIDQIDECSLRVVNMLVERSFKTHKYHINVSQLKEGVGVHVTHNNIKLFADNKLIKEISI